MKIKNIETYSDGEVSIHLTKGKLKLVHVKDSDYNTDCIDLKEKGYFKPIIISETEEIEVGDWFHEPENWIAQVKSELDLILLDPKHRSIRVKKIIVFPENLSAKEFKDIEKGKIKDGQELLIELEHHEGSFSDTPIDANKMPIYSAPYYTIKLNNGCVNIINNKETVEEALQRVKEIHGDGYYYLAIEGECPDLRELEPYQRVCSLGIEGYYCLLEDKAKDAEDNLGVILDNKHEVESHSSDWQTTNGEPLESMFGLITEEENKIIDSIAERIKKEQSKHSHFNWQKLAASKIYISLKEKIGIDLVDKFYNEFYLRRNNDFNNDTKEMSIIESKEYWIKQNIN